MPAHIIEEGAEYRMVDDEVPDGWDNPVMTVTDAPEPGSDEYAPVECEREDGEIYTFDYGDFPGRMWKRVDTDDRAPPVRTRHGGLL